MTIPLAEIALIKQLDVDMSQPANIMTFRLSLIRVTFDRYPCVVTCTDTQTEGNAWAQVSPKLIPSQYFISSPVAIWEIMHALTVSITVQNQLYKLPPALEGDVIFSVRSKSVCHKLNMNAMDKNR